MHFKLFINVENESTTSAVRDDFNLTYFTYCDHLITTLVLVIGWNANNVQVCISIDHVLIHVQHRNRPSVGGAAITRMDMYSIRVVSHCLHKNISIFRSV